MTSSNFSIGKLQNRTQLASLVKVNKDKNNGQKAAGKAVAKTNTAAAAAKVDSQNSNKNIDKSDSKSDASGTGLNGSLGMLGDYSSSEDSDE